MTTLVTGATGLLGSHLVDLLLARGEPVRILARPGEDVTQLAAAGVAVCRGGMTDPASLAAAVSGIDRVLHCAARTGPWGPEAEYVTVNVRGLKTLVDLALAAGVRRFVHVSSITVHGNDVRGTADETAPLRIEPNPYSRSKVAGERLLAALIREQGAPITIMRPGWIYGPRDAASFARFATMIRQGKMIVIGRGTNHVPLIYVRDVAQGILLASETPQAVGRAYLLVNDEPVTQRDYLDTIAAALGAQPPRRHVPYRLALTLGATAELAGHLLRRQQPPPLMRYGLQLLGGENRFDISRARHELGFVPQVNLAEGVRQSIAWYLSYTEQQPVASITRTTVKS
jgi:nucleoside-diphosphate-sugar epimerase